MLEEFIDDEDAEQQLANLKDLETSKRREGEPSNRTIDCR
jgi:hypothetical protein